MQFVVQNSVKPHHSRSVAALILILQSLISSQPCGDFGASRCQPDLVTWLSSSLWQYYEAVILFNLLLENSGLSAGSGQMCSIWAAVYRFWGSR